MTSFNLTRGQVFDSLLNFILSYEKTKVFEGLEQSQKQVPDEEHSPVEQTLRAKDLVPVTI